MAKISINAHDAVLSDEELWELDAAEKKVPVFEGDSPEMTAEMLLQFKHMNSVERNKQNISLRVSPKTFKLAKAYGKGYTAFLSRLLDEVISDEQLVKECM